MTQVMHKSSSYVFLMAGNSALGCLFFGYALGYLNVSLETINEVFKISKDEKAVINGLLTALLPIGGALGAFLAGPMLSVMSRRNTMIVTDIIAIIGILLGEILNLNTLYLARVIIGVAVGLNSTIVPLYIKEQTPLSLRGTAGSMNQICVNSGIFISFLMILGYPEDPNNNYWRTVFIVPIIFCILRALFLITIFRDDPPGYYVSKGNNQKAVEVLRKIYFEQYVQDQLTELTREEGQKQTSSSHYSDLITPLYSKRIVVGCLLCVLQQFCGINSVIFYSTDIFKQIVKTPALINTLNLAVGVTNIVFSLAAGLLMQRFGRKSLLLVGDFLCFLSLFTLAIFSYLLLDDSDNQLYQYLVVAFIFIFLIGFQLSLGPITWIYLAEILPEKGLSISVLTNWLCVSVVAQIFPILVSNLGIYSCFLIFSTFCFLGFFFILIMIKETKGRTAMSIDNMYSMQHLQITASTSQYDSYNKIQNS